MIEGREIIEGMDIIEGIEIIDLIDLLIYRNRHIYGQVFYW
jgi:hypothetical protein